MNGPHGRLYPHARDMAHAQALAAAGESHVITHSIVLDRGIQENVYLTLLRARGARVIPGENDQSYILFPPIPPSEVPVAEPKSTVGKHTLRIDITLSSPDAAANGRNLWFEVTAEEDGDVSTFLREEIKKQLVPVVETGIKALEKDIKAGPPKAPLKVLAKAYNKSIYITKRRNSIP